MWADGSGGGGGGVSRGHHGRDFFVLFFFLLELLASSAAFPILPHEISDFFRNFVIFVCFDPWHGVVLVFGFCCYYGETQF